MLNFPPTQPETGWYDLLFVIFAGLVKASPRSGGNESGACRWARTFNLKGIYAETHRRHLSGRRPLAVVAGTRHGQFHWLAIHQGFHRRADEQGHPLLPGRRGVGIVWRVPDFLEAEIKSNFPSP